MNAFRFWMLLAGLLCFTLKPSVLANDVVTLNSGEVITGTITSQNATQLVIEVSNASRTILTSRSVSKSEIKPVQRETAEGKQERLAYESILRYRLRPDQEFTVAQYDAGITACQKFLESYPTSEYAAAIKPLGFQLQQEKEQVEKGLVKFDSRWMSATLKSAEKDLRTSFIMLQQAKQALPSLEEKRRQNMGSTRTHDELFSAEQACKVANQNYEAATARLGRLLRDSSPTLKDQNIQTQIFYGTVESIDATRNTITMKSYGKNGIKTFTLTALSRFERIEGYRDVPYTNHLVPYAIFTNGKMDTSFKNCLKWEFGRATYTAEGETLTLDNVAEFSCIPGEDGAAGGEGAERKTDLTIQYVVRGGMSSNGFLIVELDGKAIAVENHPKQNSLAEGDRFHCHVRREGVFEGTDSKGQFRRLPRWVYVSDK